MKLIKKIDLTVPFIKANVLKGIGIPKVISALGLKI